jgi:hypothetical protein
MEVVMSYMMRAGVFVVALVGLHCGTSAPRIDGPSTSMEGVKIEIQEVRCWSEDPSQDHARDVQLSVRLAVTNGSAEGLQFHPERLRLAGASPGRAMWSGPSISIPKGTRRIVDVALAAGSGAECSGRMGLELADSLTPHEAIHSDPIGFTLKDESKGSANRVSIEK